MKYEKDTALKLLNKYADSYKVLEEENKILRAEIIDLRTNLKINKDIIQGFFQMNNSEERSQFYVTKLNEENKSHTKHSEKLLRENEELRSKNVNLEHLIKANDTRSKSEIEKLQNKIFIMENILIKKDNLIEGFVKKQTKINSSNLNDELFNEIYIIDPSLAVNQIHDELLLYKNIYKNLSNQIKESKFSMVKLRKSNCDLETEVTKLKQQIKLNTFSIRQNLENQNINNTPNTIINLNTHKSKNNNESPHGDKTCKTIENLSSNLKTNKTDINTLLNGTYISNTSKLNLKVLKQYETYEENNRIKKEDMDVGNGTDGKEEWSETLKHSNMSQDEFIRFSKTKSISKLIDMLEYLFKIVIERNMQLKLLTLENDNLNNNNLALNKENILLCEQNSLLVQSKEKCEKCDIKKLAIGQLTKGDTGMDSSMINNTSRNTIKENDEIIGIKEPFKKSAENAENVNKKNFYLNTLESFNSNDFREGINNEMSFMSETHNKFDLDNILIIQKIKDEM